ncbi:uncharacterized protein [Littorina saxatilis]|uniref:Uncharacterized protein n=1 Tax=Littorina saxatilis TaxID=31220 RepID=A0AAN9BUA1_9CAEN
MTSAKQTFGVAGETGSGHFGDTLGRQVLIFVEIVKNQILDAVDTIPLRSQDQVFTIGDYGAADGSVTIPLIRDIIGRVRERQGELPVQVVYEDQASNDFNSLFKRVHGLIPVPRTYLKDFKDVFVTATGAGFFEAVVPPASADLILSFNAAHYLSKPVTQFQDSLHRYPNATAEESRLVAAQAAEDWETFLFHRAKELRSGGILVMAMVADDSHNHVTGLRHCVQQQEDDMLNTWRRMRDEGKITQEEFVNTNFDRCTKYLDECTAPFKGSKSAVTKHGLQLVSAELVKVPCVARLAWRKKLDEDGVDDRETWVKTIGDHLRCWAAWNFIRALSDQRNSDEKEALVDELFTRIEKKAADTHPDDYLSDPLIAVIVARKVSSCDGHTHTT